jgi:4-hydroxy-3-polyprenylbenzoate decarboxylase
VTTNKDVFLGITGASGAPYAARLLAALSAAGCRVGVSVSDSGFEVLATELYADRGLPHDEVVARLTDGLEGVTLYDAHDYGAPYASGSARVDGYVICPCSMATVGTIAAGAMANLVHRAASVALKEDRKLVLVPRETPLSTIHLENLLRLRRAGAVIVFAAPGFYNAPQTIDDLIEFVVGRCLDQLGIENTMTRRWGQT